jgi:single-stranded DNA-binding protein
LAVDSGYGDKKRTEFISCKAFKKDAIAPYLTKGKAVLVQGEYQEEKWEKDGEKKSRPGWIINHIEFQQGDKGEAAPMQPAGKVRADMDEMDGAPF